MTIMATTPMRLGSLSLVLLLLFLVASFSAKALSLKEEINNQILQAELQEANALVNEDDDLVDDTEVENSTDPGTSNIALLQSKLSLRFDCGARNQTSCEQKFCVYYDDQCMVSPAGFDLSCQLYCGSECAPAKVKNGACSVKFSSVYGMCSSFQQQSNCNAQAGICEWKDARCAPIQGCCSAALDFCKTRRRKSKTKAIKLCAGKTDGSNLCAYATGNC